MAKLFRDNISSPADRTALLALCVAGLLLLAAGSAGAAERSSPARLGTGERERPPREEPARERERPSGKGSSGEREGAGDGSSKREGGGSGKREGKGGGASGGEGRTPQPGNLAPEEGQTVTDPIDPRFLTDVPFGARSFWLQPWRAYLDTWPASRLSEGLGINFPENPAFAQATARLLHESGFRLARIQIGWSTISYEDPTEFAARHLRSIETRLQAMREYGLRPLILLYAGSEDPTPFKTAKLETLADAPEGATTVKLSAPSAAQVVPGRTGFNNLTFHGSPDVLITSVSSGGVATLSRPLTSSLPAGVHGGSTLRFAPFQSPTLPGGASNPTFHETLQGWLQYVAAVSRLATRVVGPGNFDLEVWNELTFGSQFLNAGNYYAPGTAPGEPGGQSESGGGGGGSEAEEGEGAEGEEGGEGEEAEGEEGAEGGEEGQEGGGAGLKARGAGASARAAKPVKKVIGNAIRDALLDETVAFVRNPANGISPAVGITDGFASETPFPSGADAPPGLTALSKHPYTGAKEFPADLRADHVRPINALGGRDTATRGGFEPLFTPTYQSLFPEYWLSATSTETLIRDIAPFTTKVYGFPHGRNVGPPGGPPVQKWITEFNQIPAHGIVMEPDGVTPASGAAATLSAADKAHFQAKVALRSLVSNIAKGVAREYFYHAAPGPFSLVEEGFFKALEADPGAYPGFALGGPTMTALRNLLAHFEGPGPGGPARQLTLTSIEQEGDHAQFQGDGSAQHPALYDRDVLLVAPFQSAPSSFVIPFYVMTRDLLTLYEPSASPSDVRRFDLPDETFRITLGNLPEGGGEPTVSAYDPLLNSQTPARLLARSGASATFEVAATDYPRLLSVEF